MWKITIPPHFVERSFVMFGTLLDNSPFTKPGVRYGDWLFSEPRPLLSTFTPNSQGLYVVVVPDSLWSPRPFRLLYVGETADLKSRIGPHHEKYSSWKREAGQQTLHFAVASTFGFTDLQRKAHEEALIRQYNPPCNIALRSLIFPR